MKNRTISKALLRAIKTFPALVVTGPRQSGKTTLLKMLFSKTHSYVSLEDPDTRMRAKEDPKSFLSDNSSPLILDEIQYVPELLSYIKTKIDEDRKPGQWIFTGSQNFVLMQNISQSLAGRIAVFNLLPFSYSELTDNAENSVDMDSFINMLNHSSKEKSKSYLAELLLRGYYPEIAINKKVDRQLWCSSYIATYLERDVRNLAHIGDLNQFERFLKLCAIRTGQIINLSEISREIGISVPTVKRWISILETGHLIYLLYPYYRNLGKRLIKSPKLYFNDTALVSYLLGIHDKETLINSTNYGNLFETMIVIDFLKRFINHGQQPSMYYLRTRDGLEIDLVIEINQKLNLFEIKSSMTINVQHAYSLIKMQRELKSQVKSTGIISGSENFRINNNIHNYNWSNILEK